MTATENTSDTKDRISIQVALSGYSFKVQSCDGSINDSGWQTPDRMFVTKALQRRYNHVDISLFTPKVALFPGGFFIEAAARSLLSDVVLLSDSDSVEYIELPELASVLVYSTSIGETLSKAIASSVLRTDGYKAVVFPELYFMLKQLSEISDYNKIIASFADDRIYLVIAQGKSLLLCNSYEAEDFNTALYFLFSVMKKLQLNPEVSSVYFRTPLSETQEMTLYRYFSSVEQI